MATPSTPLVALVTCLVGLAAAACSGRVEMRSNEDDPSGGNGGDGSGSARGGKGGSSGSIGPSEGGRIGRGGGPSYPGGGPSQGGGIGVAGGAGCTASGSDCLGSCLCFGNDKQFCYDACVGGSGGSAGSPGCNPQACPLRVSPDLPVAATPCCLPDGSCGIDLSQFAGVLGVATGCQASDQPGWPTSQCQLQPPLSSGAIEPCCRLDKSCGIRLDFVSVGCAKSVGGPSGGPRYCDPIIGVGGGGPGGAGGFVSAGGRPSAGGFVSAGGQVGAGGSRTVDQCIASAQSDCERCVCKSCNTSLDGCFQDAGCPLILQCANLTGCTGVDCYQPNTCQAIIDRFGGIGSPSTSLAIPLFGCAQNCGCGFGQ